MTNQDAYLHDLEDLRKEIDYLLSMVPIARRTSRRARTPKMQQAEPDPPSPA